MNKTYLIKSAAPLAVALMLTGCVDDNYDLTDIDTTSQIKVKDLTVPINLGEIKLENVLKLEDNENISVENGRYTIKKEGNISTDNFKISPINVSPAAIEPSEIKVATMGVTVTGQQTLTVPASAKSNYDISLNNVDPTLLSVTNVKSANPIEMKITLEVPSALTSGSNSVTFENFDIQLPWGLMNATASGANASYDSASGNLHVGSLSVGNDGKASITLKADGVELGAKGAVVNKTIAINGQVGLDGGQLNLNLSGVKLPDPLTIKASYSISSFSLASFSGEIDYRMDGIDIAPISLSDLPDFLDNPETKIYLANPGLTINITNPVGQYGVSGSGNLKLTSYFDGGNTTTAISDKFHIDTTGGIICFGTADWDGITPTPFPGFSDILANDNQGGLPGSVKVSVENLSFAGNVIDFPIQHGNQGVINGAKGDYTFTAPLGFKDGTYIVYEDTEGDWGGDDLDDINITFINLTANCHTNVPVSLELQVLPIDRDGNLIPVDEDSSKFKVPAMCQGQPVQLTVKARNGGVINHFDGIKFRAVITQESGNGEALSPDLYISLSDLRITVDGYFEKKL